MDNLLNINHSEFQRAVNLLFLKKENSSDLKEQKAPYDKYSEKMSDCYKNEKRNLTPFVKKSETLETASVEGKDMLLSIFIYTTEKGYKQLGQYRKNIKNIIDIKPYIDTLISALNELPPFTDKVFRHVKVDENKHFSINQEICFDTFTSSTYDKKYIHKNKKRCFEIKSKTGVKIDCFSKFPNESEVLFLPGTKVVVKFCKGKNHFVMDEK